MIRALGLIFVALLCIVATVVGDRELLKQKSQQQIQREQQRLQQRQQQQQQQQQQQRQNQGGQQSQQKPKRKQQKNKGKKNKGKKNKGQKNKGKVAKRKQGGRKQGNKQGRGQGRQQNQASRRGQQNQNNNQGQQQSRSTGNDKSVGVGCFQFENCGGSQGRWRLEKGKGSGCGLYRWTGGNQYSTGQVGGSDIKCFNFRAPSPGQYKVAITGIRNTNGRKTIQCSENNKPRDLRECQQRNGRRCVCNDEENDVWLKVEGRATSLGTTGNWYKAMVNCPWDKMCSIATLNVDHKFYQSKYQLSGNSRICLAGRSVGLGIDKVCVTRG